MRIADIQWTLDSGTSESIVAGSEPTVAAASDSSATTTSTCTRVANGRTEYVYLDSLPIALLR